jgi:multidrug resistance efflux pump
MPRQSLPVPVRARPFSESNALGARGGVAAHSASAPAPPRHPPPPRPPSHLPAPQVAGPARTAMVDQQAVIFRAEVVRPRHEEAAVDVLPEVGTSWWVLLGVLLSAVLALLGFGWFGHVEVTSTALGSLRVQSGPRPVLAQTSGTVSELMVGAGDLVHVGQPVAKLRAAHLEAQENKLSEQQSLLEEGQRRASAMSLDLHARTLRALKSKRRIVGQRLALEESRVARLERRNDEIHTLVREGAASGTEALAAQSALDSAREGALILRQQVADVTLELLDRQNAHGTELLNRELRVQQSGAELGEAEALTELATLSAPVSGRVESLLVSAGQVVPTGATIARIVPEGDVHRAVVFVPSKEAAFVREGLSAKLEFPSLPVSDFGRARARVERVASDVASAAEVAEVLEGAASGVDAVVRVELVIEDDATWQQMAPRLRSGARVMARLMTRERRIVSLAFDFVKQWLPE